MAETISLSLVSHTNVGKTTLARTLLAADVGEVRDAPHVTEFADEHELLRSPDGDRLTLWDTPGFGDSARLARRLRQSGNPIGWFLGEVWDRWRDRPFWASQQALRNVRERADVVLYLVNAAEEPAAAGYVAPEMELLDWLGKPVLVLLNQMGAPRAAADEDADLQRWALHLAGRTLVRAVLPMDAFARCWVQEGRLWQAVEQALDGGRRPAMARLRQAWATQRLATFDASMSALATMLASVASTHVAVGGAAGLRAALRQIGTAMGLPGGGPDPQQQAQQVLSAQLDAALRDGTGELIALHGLQGQAQAQIAERVATHFELRRKVDEGRAALVGGMLSGALTGLTADLASGGLTLGGGLIAGGLLGALGAAGAAHGLNRVRGSDRDWLGWNADAMDLVLRAALLRYLAVAHFGRGRGDWVAGEAPAHWVELVDQGLAARAPSWSAIWQARRASFDNPGEAEALAAVLQPLLIATVRDLLQRLYPGSWPGPTDNPPT